MSRVIACLLISALPCTAVAAANPSDLQKKARARMKSLDFEAALPLLEQLRELPNVAAPLRAQNEVDLGITFVNLGRAEDARRAFDEALIANPEVPLPAGVPPKIRKLFEDVKAARAVAPLPPPPAVTVPKEEPAPPPVAAVVDPVVVQKERMVLAPVVLLGAGAVFILAGASTAFAAQSAGHELSESLHTSAEAQALLSSRASLGTSSYVCYGLGAALAITGAALFVFSGGTTQVSAFATPGGGAVSVQGAF